MAISTDLADSLGFTDRIATAEGAHRQGNYRRVSGAAVVKAEQPGGYDRSTILGQYERFGTTSVAAGTASFVLEGAIDVPCPGASS